jgi:hypothetical protein
MKTPQEEAAYILEEEALALEKLIEANAFADMPTRVEQIVRKEIDRLTLIAQSIVYPESCDKGGYFNIHVHKAKFEQKMQTTHKGDFREGSFPTVNTPITANT